MTQGYRTEYIYWIFVEKQHIKTWSHIFGKQQIFNVYLLGTDVMVFIWQFCYLLKSYFEITQQLWGSKVFCWNYIVWKSQVNTGLWQYIYWIFAFPYPPLWTCRKFLSAGGISISKSQFQFLCKYELHIQSPHNK